MAQLGEVFGKLRFFSRNNRKETKHNSKKEVISKGTVVETSYAVALAYISHLLKENGIEEDEYLQALHQYLPSANTTCMHKGSTLTASTEPSTAESEFCDQFIDLCDELKEQHWNFFEDLIVNLSLTEDNARTVFMTISKMIYEDAVNWGRIFTLYAFAGTFAIHFGKKGETELVGEIPYWIADVFENYLSDWIIDQGGWVSFFFTLPVFGECRTMSKW